MSSYSYVAVNPAGAETRGTLDVPDQIEAVRRIKEMGLFPTKVLAEHERKSVFTRPPSAASVGRHAPAPSSRFAVLGFGARVPVSALTVFTRQTATLMDAGMPLLRGLRTLHEQEENRTLRRVIAAVSESIESGNSFAEALAQFPKVFNPLYLNMVKAGELGGALELTLTRLAEFMEKAQKNKGKVKAAMFYPCAVMIVAVAIMAVLMIFVVPRFQEVFNGLLEGRQMPGFTLLVLHASEAVKSHLALTAATAVTIGVLFVSALKTSWGREVFDRLKLSVPGLGPVFRKVAISRFARTLGTLVGSGVPILQALTIVRETAGNVVVGSVIGTMHDRVKEGDPMAPTLKASGVFPPMVAGMVDVGEQTGALPEMLMKVADNYDDEVDNATNAMTSLLEPVMIVFLAVIVGSIVIAMFLPLIRIMTEFGNPPGQPDN
jgi:type IV pilus assembly protein PilC